MELSIKFERLGQDGPFYILRDFIKKKISFLSLEIESVLEYSVYPDEKSFVQYFLWIFTDFHSPRLLQIDLNKILTILFSESKTTISFATTIIPCPFGRTVTLCTFDQCLHCDMNSFKLF